jgi:D-aminoacyl-tRNA deacylase
VIAVVVSRADSASTHVGEHLLDLADWEVHDDPTRPDADGGGRVHRTDGFELRPFDALHLEIEGAADAFDDPDLLVFASRHSGETGPLLTAHFTGNFGPAEFGGEDARLARACPNALARLLEAFDDHVPAGYEVGMECTHHGPSAVGVPSMFVELGSGEDQWNDPGAARAVARSILDLRGVGPHRDRQLVGFGGGHYVPRFSRIVRETDWAVGHVAADWSLEAMGNPVDERDTLRQAFEASRAEHAVLDGNYPDLRATVEDLGYRVVSETWVRETDGVPLSLVEACEQALCPVDDGLRFGNPAEDPEVGNDFVVVSLPDELLAEAATIDADRTSEIANRHLVAYETRENGTRVAGRAAVADEATRENLVDDLVTLLAERYDAVEREGGAVVVRETAFDPSKAAELGVPEGPEFGRLADGEPVTVDGETVEPSAVHSERTKRFPV